MPAEPARWNPEPPEGDTDEPADRVCEWRHQQLAAAGWPEPYAFMLATLTDVDLHQACDLVRQGCDPMLAWQILA